MQRRRPTLKATGFYIAAAIIGYALVGALLDNIYLPGKYGDGVHLHNEAIPPALLGLTLFALTFPLMHFRESAWVERADKALKTGAILCMVLSLHFVASPSGRELATLEECHATVSRMEAFTRELSDGAYISKMFQEERARCAESPMLKTFHECIERAREPHDANHCRDESIRQFERKNSS